MSSPSNRRDHSAGCRGRRWTVVIPVKRAAAGKSRLALPPAERAQVNRAIALDTIAAAADCDQVGRVLVVTADAPLTEALAEFDRVVVIPDTADGLGQAVRLGLAAADDGAPRAALLGDLPALKPGELSAALGLAADHPRAYVPDADGTGTVLVTACAGTALHPLFGADSARAHGDAGFRTLPFPAESGLRRDLDSITHLPALRAHGLGPRTARLIG